MLRIFDKSGITFATIVNEAMIVLIVNKAPITNVTIPKTLKSHLKTPSKFLYSFITKSAIFFTKSDTFESAGIRITAISLTAVLINFTITFIIGVTRPFKPCIMFPNSILVTFAFFTSSVEISAFWFLNSIIF